MRTKLCLVLGMTAALGLLSCNEDRIISNTQLVKSICVTGQDFQNGDAAGGTRAAYTVDDSGFHFSWTTGDTVGIYPVGGDQVAFPISSGEGSQTAKFDGGAWALRSSYSYAAYYPYVKENYMANESSIPVSYTGQKQNGNGSLDCLDRYDYQASIATRPDAGGNVNIELKHLGCFVRFQITMPIADTYKSVTLTSSKTSFVTSGTFDLTKSEIAITPKASSSSITIDLDNTSTTIENKTLTVYAMLAPQDLSKNVNQISISIAGTQYTSYTTTIYGKNMQAGKAYNYSATVQSGTNINGEDVTWDDNGQEIINSPYHYVDLGLSVNWATFNVGATKPEEYGDYYAWGEVETYYEAGYAQEDPQTHWKDGKSEGYWWPSYKWCRGTDKTLTKYCSISEYSWDGIPDNKTILELEDDAAHVNWGGNWRMPTKEEQEELLNNCTWTWYGEDNTEFGGVVGYKVTSNKEGYTDRFIFLPFAGERVDNDELYMTEGDYWSSSLSVERPSAAWYLYLWPDKVGHITVVYGCDHTLGHTIRPVCPSERFIVSSIELDKTTISLIAGGNSKQIKVTTKNSVGALGPAADVSWSSSDESVASVSSDGTVTAVGTGACTITAKVGNLTPSTCTVRVRPDESENGYSFVDLGLSVMWATYNVGATKPEEYGDYYAWGDTATYYEEGYAQEDPQTHWKEGKTDGYTWSNYKWCNGSNTSLTKYNTDSRCGIVDNKTTLDPEDDVAHVKWGGAWRMPTYEEHKELYNNCTWIWTTVNGVNGYMGTSKVPGYTDRSIFFPAAGEFDFDSLAGVGKIGEYISSSLHQNSNTYAKDFSYCGTEYPIEPSSYMRYLGYTIRPICP